MANRMQLLHILRRGPRPRQVQAWAGLILLAGAGLWLLWKLLLPILGAVAVAVVGALLLRRSMRGSPPSS